MTTDERLERANRAALLIVRTPCATLDQVLCDGPEEDLLALERIIERVRLAQSIDRMERGLLG